MNIAPVGRDGEHILIRTTMNRPRLPDGMIARPRLLERLDETSGRRITLISAPAGYGKTTVAIQWLERCPGKVAWISLDPDDSDPDRFSKKGGRKKGDGDDFMRF